MQEFTTDGIIAYIVVGSCSVCPVLSEKSGNHGIYRKSHSAASVMAGNTATVPLKVLCWFYCDFSRKNFGPTPAGTVTTFERG